MLAPSSARALFAAALAVATTAYAQKPAGLPGGYPSRPIRIVVGASPGGGTDIVTRLVAQKLSERWGNPVIIENRGSTVGGLLGMDVAARATPDGYTLMAVAASAVLNAALINKPAYDQRKAFTPVGQMTSQPYLLAVHPSVPAQSVKEFIALAKSKPGVLNGGSAGVGTMTHLGLELFKSIAGVDIAHIPYKGTGPAVIDLVSGQTQMMFASGLSIMAHAKSGRVRVLGVTTLERSRLLANLPTLNESGVPGFELNGWYALLAPTGTPPQVVAALNREIVQIVQQPELTAKFAGDGSEPAPGTPDELRARINRDIDSWTKLFERTGIKL